MLYCTRILRAHVLYSTYSIRTLTRTHTNTVYSYVLYCIFVWGCADDLEVQIELGSVGRVVQPRYSGALQTLIAEQVSHVRDVLSRRSAGYSAISAALANSTCQALKLMSIAAGIPSIRELTESLEQFINMQHTRVCYACPLTI